MNTRELEDSGFEDANSTRPTLTDATPWHAYIEDDELEDDATDDELDPLRDCLVCRMHATLCVCNGAS